MQRGVNKTTTGANNLSHITNHFFRLLSVSRARFSSCNSHMLTVGTWVRGLVGWVRCHCEQLYVGASVRGVRGGRTNRRER